LLLSLPATQPASAATRGHALDLLDLPSSNAETSAYAIDLDGDGNTDNQFGAVLVAMASNLGTDIPASTQSDVAAGRVVHLIELRSSDAAFANDPAAVATWYVGQATAGAPLFDGSDTFRYDPAVEPARFVAPLAGGSFVSANPVTTSAPVGLPLRLRIGAYPIELGLQGARLAFNVVPTGLVQGRVNGSISSEEIDAVFVPTLATSYNDIVQANPGSKEAMTLLGLFDNAPEDGAISVAEVRDNSLFQSLLAPDVDIRDANGNYAPNPANTTPDSLSFGFAFTAVVSTTLLPRVFADGFE
jgi:hypothetical protein